MQSQECGVRQSALKGTVALLLFSLLSFCVVSCPLWVLSAGQTEKKNTQFLQHSPVTVSIVASLTKLQWFYWGWLSLVLFFVYRCCQNMMRRRTLGIQDAHVLLQTQPLCLGLSPQVERCADPARWTLTLRVAFIVCLFVCLPPLSSRCWLWMGNRWLNICLRLHLSFSEVRSVLVQRVSSNSHLSSGNSCGVCGWFSHIFVGKCCVFWHVFDAYSCCLSQIPLMTLLSYFCLINICTECSYCFLYVILTLLT